jgi:hypothetical protein
MIAHKTTRIESLFLDYGCPPEQSHYAARFACFLALEVAEETRDEPWNLRSALYQTWSVEFPQGRRTPWTEPTVAWEVAEILGMDLERIPPPWRQEKCPDMEYALSKERGDS